MLKIGIITGSTRPNRKSLDIAKWFLDIASNRGDAEYVLVDLKDFELPLFDEAMPPMMHQYQHAHTKRWAERIGSLDAFIFVTPEYNHGVPGVLKNAIDFIYAEWNNKAAGMVTYGGAGGARCAEQLRLVLAEMQVATVRAQVMLSLIHDFEHFTTFKPGEQHQKSVGHMLDQVIAWAGAFKPLRAAAAQ
jgi:NAD(P)H-dependent FMN reductase